MLQKVTSPSQQHRQRERLSRMELFKLQRHCQEMLKCLHWSVQEEIFEIMKEKLLREKNFLNENYYKLLSVFLNDNIR